MSAFFERRASLSLLYFSNVLPSSKALLRAFVLCGLSALMMGVQREERYSVLFMYFFHWSLLLPLSSFFFGFIIISLVEKERKRRRRKKRGVEKKKEETNCFFFFVETQELLNHLDFFVVEIQKTLEKKAKGKKYARARDIYIHTKRPPKSSSSSSSSRTRRRTTVIDVP